MSTFLTIHPCCFLFVEYCEANASGGDENLSCGKFTFKVLWRKCVSDRHKRRNRHFHSQFIGQKWSCHKGWHAKQYGKSDYQTSAISKGDIGVFYEQRNFGWNSFLRLSSCILRVHLFLLFACCLVNIHPGRPRVGCLVSLFRQSE